MLQLDNAENAIGKAPGHLKSLDLRGSTFIGSVPNASKRFVFKDIIYIDKYELCSNVVNNYWRFAIISSTLLIICDSRQNS